MMKKFYFPLLVTVIVAMSSCSSKMGELPSDYFTTTPQVLEAIGGQVPVTINGKFPEKYFNKKAVVEVTPVLRWNGGQAKGQTAVFQGEKVEGNDQTISYKMGGNYTMKTSFNYVPEMAKSELYLEFNAKVGDKSIAIPAVKIADGVIATSELIGNTLSSATPATGHDTFQRIIKEAQQAHIMFLIQQANLRSSELNSEDIKKLNEQIAAVDAAPNKKISNIEVSAYASPDGGVSLNTKLAEQRESNTTDYVNRQLRKAKVDAALEAKYTAQDWEGFQELVSNSNIQDKELILRVLSMYKDPQQREQEIKNISSVYKTLADVILPQLRRSRLTLNYEIIGKSDDEISNLATNNPALLNIEELLYAATLTNNSTRQEAIYTQATKQFPKDYRAFNNLGKLAYETGDLAKAESFVNKAASLKAAPEVNMNQGLIALVKGDKASAESYFGKASGTPELNESLGNLYVAQGQYQRAVNSFGDVKSNSAALAQILSKDYNKANNTLSNIEKPDAYTEYLKAVLGARTNNTSAVISSLKKAVQQDSSLAKKAANDIEFAKLLTNSDFVSIIR
ncbi:tetratricopeptide repeat protein [Bacteroides sp. 519]|uniref:tetratricopeptide repeat protein n=1 Tax=Bacteroides sp. 519 TaxID=2302937 RepID=UPI0013D8436F|nr:tetratricopeptide repeat protein [Bacteroides sp. 519]NDV57570.1 hypothetical protein [Bacteroides sp. 519]